MATIVIAVVYAVFVGFLNWRDGGWWRLRSLFAHVVAWVMIGLTVGVMLAVAIGIVAPMKETVMTSHVVSDIRLEGGIYTLLFDDGEEISIDNVAVVFGEVDRPVLVKVDRKPLQIMDPDNPPWVNWLALPCLDPGPSYQLILPPGMLIR